MKLFDADWWELYTTSMDCMIAADILANALRAAVTVNCEKMALDIQFTAEDAAVAIYEYMTVIIMPRFSEFGATDTEPKANLRRWLRRKFAATL